VALRREHSGTFHTDFERFFSILCAFLLFFKLDEVLEHFIGCPSIYYQNQIAKMRPVNNSTLMVSKNNSNNLNNQNNYGMTLLGNDVLVCGGRGGQYLSLCTFYNAFINEWAAAAAIQ
jgi:hypothetical protein